MAKTAPQIELELRALLSQCTLAAQGLYQQMRYVVEDMFADVKSRKDAGTIPEELPHRLAGRESGRTPVILAQLTSADIGLVTVTGDRLSLPHVNRICDLKLKSQRSTAKWREGVTSDPLGCHIRPTPSLSFPCPYNPILFLTLPLTHTGGRTARIPGNARRGSRIGFQNP